MAQKFFKKLFTKFSKKCILRTSYQSLSIQEPLQKNGCRSARNPWLNLNRKKGDKTKTTYIGIAGEVEADFLICLCELLAESNLKIAVIDNTKEAELFSKVSFLRNEDSLTYHKIEYKRNIHSFDEEEKFDFVFLKPEIFSQDKFFVKVEKWFLFLTPQREKMERLAVSFSHVEEPILLYIRDFCEYKITSAFIRKKWAELGGHFTGWYEIPFDTLDYEYRMRLQYEPVNEWKQFSKEMREVLIQTACHFTGFTQKEQRIIYQKIKRGKCRCR